jgi:hypothetical protein
MQANPIYSFHTGAVRWVAPELMIEPEDQIVSCKTKSRDIYALGGIMLQVLSLSLALLVTLTCATGPIWEAALLVD